MPFANRAKKLKNQSGVTLHQLSEAVNVSESTLSRYLNGSIIPPEDVAHRIMEFLQAEAAESAIENATQGDMEDMQNALESIKTIYESRITDLWKIIDDLKQSRRVLAIALTAAIIFIFALFTIDLLNPDMGWFRY